MAIICNVAVPLRFFFSIMMPPIRIAPFKILSVTRPLSEIGLQIFFPLESSFDSDTWGIIMDILIADEKGDKTVLPR